MTETNHPDWTVANLQVVADFFGASRKTVRDWRRKGMPGRRGHWDLSAIAQWWRSSKGGASPGPAFNHHLDDGSVHPPVHRQRGGSSGRATRLVGPAGRFGGRNGDG